MLTVGSRTIPKSPTDAQEGGTPVASLVAIAVDQVDRYLADQGDDVLADVPPPEGWSGAREWSDRVRALVRDEVRPALAKWRDAVAALPARADTECGLNSYSRLIKVHTTVDRTVGEIHDLGLAQVAE